MSKLNDEVLIRQLSRIKFLMQTSLENIGLQQDVTEGQRLLTIADRELMMLINELKKPSQTS